MKASISLITGSLALCCALAQSAAASDASTAALERLKAGNARFVSDLSQPPQLNASRKQELAKGQHPFATILSCADSRVPPEHVFNVGLGDLFVVRVAGEVTDHSVLASVEYAAEHLDVPLVVVLAHESCGAVKAAVDSDGTSLGPNLDYLVRAIAPAVKRTKSEQNQLKAAILANAQDVVGEMLHGSEILSHLVGEGKLKVVSGYYELGSGQVTFLPSEAPVVHHSTK